MADLRLTDSSSFINQQIQTQEKIEACLWKLEALMTIAVSADDFYDCPESILHNYFSIAGDLIAEAMITNQLSLKALFKHSKTDIISDN